MNTTRQHITALTETGPVTARTTLIGRDDLDLIVAELTAALQPCDMSVALAEAKRLAACYPTFRPAPEWLEEIADALRNAPCDLIGKARRSLADTATFPPNRAQVRETVQAVTGRRHAALFRARAMIAEHDRRAAVIAEEKAREAFRIKLAGRSPAEFFREEAKE